MVLETSTIGDQLFATLSSPPEMLHWIVLSLIGTIYLTVFFYNKRFASWHRPPKKYKMKTPYDSTETEELKNIGTKLSQSFIALITVYGVLLAFVISDKIAFALTSWSFLIWTGWVLAVIVRAGLMLMSLVDMFEKKYSIDFLRQKIFGIKEFFKLTLVMLPIAIAFLPAFILLDDPSTKFFESLPWEENISILIGAFGILAATLLFIIILGLFPRERVGVFSC